jgi:hypothetical protein
MGICTKHNKFVYVKMGTNLRDSEYGPMKGFCENGNELFRSIKQIISQTAELL